MPFSNAPYMEPMFPHQDYEDRIVAFIDVLGFSEMVSRGSSDVKQLRHLTSALSEFHNLIWLWESNGVKSSFAFTQFSDSIVVSALAESQDSFEMLQEVLRGVVMLAGRYDILVRGGITRGPLIHDDTMLVGPAMVEAYKLESKKAVYPRIIIDETLEREYDRLLRESLKAIGNQGYPEWDKIFSKDTDGWWYLDYLHPADGYYLADVPMGFDDYKDHLREIARKGKQSPVEGVQDKYRWLEEKLLTREEGVLKG